MRFGSDLEECKIVISFVRDMPELTNWCKAIFFAKIRFRQASTLKSNFLIFLYRSNFLLKKSLTYISFCMRANFTIFHMSFARCILIHKSEKKHKKILKSIKKALPVGKVLWCSLIFHKSAAHKILLLV